MRCHSARRDCLLPKYKCKLSLLYILSAAILLISSGCTMGSPLPSQQIFKATQTVNSTQAPTTSPPPNRTHNPLQPNGGPYLLIQSDFTKYQMLDLSTGAAIPFNPPGENIQHNLDAGLSPSGQKMFFLMDDNSIVLTDLFTGEVLNTLNLIPGESIFKPELTLEKLETPGVSASFDDQEMLTFIEKSFQDSLMNVRWYQSDRYLLLPSETSPTSTTLSLYDHETNAYTNLESQPALVEDCWVGPGGENILLKKGYINESRFWQDDRYYILNINNLTVQAIPLPEDVHAPTLFWISPEILGITHQTGLVGGENFSIYDIRSGEWQQIITGPFTHIRQYADGFLVLKENNKENTTTISLITPLGETITEKSIGDRCFYKGMINQALLLNCQSESYILDQELNQASFGGVITILSPAPDRNFTVIVNRAGVVKLLDNSTKNQQLLDLEGDPLEVRWLHDSSGFIYRISGKLFWYDRVQAQSQQLLTSDFFSDYRNLNAVWIGYP